MLLFVTMHIPGDKIRIQNAANCDIIAIQSIINTIHTPGFVSKYFLTYKIAFPIFPPTKRKFLSDQKIKGSDNYKVVSVRGKNICR